MTCSIFKSYNLEIEYKVSFFLTLWEMKVSGWFFSCDERKDNDAAKKVKKIKKKSHIFLNESKLINIYLAFIVILISLSILNEAWSKLGDPKKPIALFEKPYCSIGTPKKLKSNFWLLLLSI